MGNCTTRPVSSFISTHTPRYHSHPSYLKSESQKIIEFIGRIEYRQKSKSRTECDFDGSGYDHVLYYSFICSEKLTDELNSLFTASSFNCGRYGKSSGEAFQRYKGWGWCMEVNARVVCWRYYKEWDCGLSQVKAIELPVNIIIKCSLLYKQHPNNLVHPKMSHTLSLSGMYPKSFIYCTNRTNSQ